MSKNNFNIIPPPKLRLSNGLFSSGTPTKTFYQFLKISDIILSNFFLINYSHDLGDGVELVRSLYHSNYGPLSSPC